jgi:titin
MFAMPGCDDDTWTYLGGIPVSSRYTNSIALGFPASAISRDTSFRWLMVLDSIYGDSDRAPDAGWRQVGIEAAPALASAPRALDARISSRTIELTWRAPLSDGGSRITGHAVQIRSGRSGWTTVSGATSARRTATLTRLVNGRTYDVRVAAVTAAGRGAWSGPVQATPAGAPGTPRGLDARARERGAVVSWRRPADEGGRRITDYTVQVSADNGRIWRSVADGRSPATSVVVDGLRPGRRHLVRVAARNDVGRGPWSRPVAVTPRGG